MLNRWIIGLLLISNNSAALTYSLSEAVQKKLVTVQFSGAKTDTAYRGEYSSHYGPCMLLEAKSIVSQNINLQLEYGYQLVPEDSALQTMMVTQTLMVQLAPKQKRHLRVYAMCTQAHDAAPSADKQFMLRKRAGGSLLGLAELINRKKYQTDAGQNAVWCLTDDYEISSIFSQDTVMMYELRTFVAKAKGLDLKTIYTASDIPANTPVKTFTTRTVYSGSFSYRFSKPSKILIALFDEANHMKRVYVNNETQREGEYTYKYQIGSDETENKKHYLRLFRDGKLQDEISIIPEN